MEKEKIEEKIESLLSSMSLDEKVAQLKARSISISKVIGKLLLEDFFSELRPELKEKIMGFIFNFYSNRELAEGMTKTLWRKMWKEVVLEGVEKKYPIGELSCALRSMSPRESAQFANEIQKYVLENSRVKIPILIHDEALHGCMAKGSTIFPQAIGMASTWNPELIYQVATAIGKETRSRGIHQVLSPTINIARDPRCGRTEETYGEDPYLASRMAVAYIKGVQEQGVISTPKHFVANFVGDGGRDSYPIHFSERLLREIYFPAFRASIEEAGALSLMAAYNSLDGIPCSSNKWLLTRILRKEWGFKGYVVSDYFSVLHLMTKHKVAESKAEAAKLSLEAGLDMELPDSDCFEEIPGLIRESKLSQDTLDEAVRRVLRVKFWIGLFDNPFVDPDYAERINDCSEHRELALRVARESIVLLKNEGILPLNKDIRSIAVIGPNAAVPRLGGYSGYGVKVVTPLEGIKNKLGDKVKVYFAEGCGLNDTSKSGFDEAIKIAQKSDVAILFMGNSVPETEGEQRDRHNLNLPGVQEDLIKEICNTNTPVIVVLINGSAITMMNWIDKVQAVIEAWYPGEEGGNAIADVLFGDYNPGGKLPISFPKYSSQLPLYYNHKPSGRVDDYVDLRGNQYLFPFGYGLSYTDFKYSNLRITPEEIPRDGEVVITFDIENIGKYKGDEVVQLYLHDEFASVARPIKELKRFERVTLDVGERKTVSFKLNRRDLEFLSMDMELVVEPGRFEVLIGSSSEDIRLKGFFIVK
ncbi:MAG: glycoside hydrolase family 3 C-terminal domain-containing protein [Dictyoglomus thermophilum]|uniref:glycoside hydrolase family 3 N-terminal domain-containing protein n=1 Tax=Dictyoglomus thermophilum TaxID=14 RepID=UPI0011EB572B|nr:glycoside hydrolase family 3 N-terminal domain-containing protein [Dictyoglomus thermophilum]MCX7720482.1 glycoside hydrolase family 3 C-terminal domain-containing protein [Dictyoglomus thermophilum]TYT24384.1 beta-glucosidase [Dictyoglomus thermophilum]